MVNVIIPVYKSRQTLPNALDSLVAQTKKLFYVTIIQDGDNEDYTDIIDEYTRRGLHIVTYYQEENTGPGLARQYGIDRSDRFDYVMFLDSDDMLMPRAVEKLYSEAKRNDADVMSSSVIAEGSAGKDVFLDVATTPVTWFHGKIYKLDYLKKINLRFLKELRVNEDSYFNLVAWNSTKKTFQLHETTYLWRNNKDSLTRREGQKKFFMDTYDTYVYAQVAGMKKLAEVNESFDPLLLAKIFIFNYEYMMAAIHLGVDITKSTEMYAELLKHPIMNYIGEIIGDTTFWEYIREKGRDCQIEDDEVYFYKYTFGQWLLKFILGKEEE